MTIISLILLIKKPERRTVFFLIGFGMMAIHFWYNKHIVQNLADQTVNTVFFEGGYYRGQWLTEAIFYHLFPLVMWIISWGSIFLAVVNPKFKFMAKKKSLTSTISEQK
ncbi:MAG: hypothetical protein LBG64_01725 [Pseudomonadales bacterium]|nr:hypothetical protein [Pseudomonadales bacterium]